MPTRRRAAWPLRLLAAVLVVLAVFVVVRPAETAAPESKPWIYSQTSAHLGFHLYWWDGFTNAEPDASVTGYDVQYRQQGDTTWLDWTHTGTVRAVAFSGLTAGQAYQVRIRATNSDGNGPWSLIEDVTAVASRPTTMDPPFPLQVEAGDTQATVTWDQPSHTGGRTLTGYVVRLYLHNVATELRSITVSGATTTSTVISGLTNDTAYQVAMYATFAVPGNVDGGGRPTARTQAFTPTASQVTPQDAFAAIVDTTTLAITEGSSGTFTAALTGDPGASVTVTLVRTHYSRSEYGQPDHRWNLNAATVSPATLTFTAGGSGNYATPQAVTVTGAEDDDCVSEQLVILLLVAGGDSRYEAVGGSVIGVFVTVADDDACGGL